MSQSSVITLQVGESIDYANGYVARCWGGSPDYILAAAFLFYAITLQRDATATDCGITAARGVDVSNVAECAR